MTDSLHTCGIGLSAAACLHVQHEKCLRSDWSAVYIHTNCGLGSISTVWFDRSRFLQITDVFRNHPRLMYIFTCSDDWFITCICSSAVQTTVSAHQRLYRGTVCINITISIYTYYSLYLNLFPCPGCWSWADISLMLYMSTGSVLQLQHLSYTSLVLLTFVAVTFFVIVRFKNTTYSAHFQLYINVFHYTAQLLAIILLLLVA